MGFSLKKALGFSKKLNPVALGHNLVSGKLFPSGGGTDTGPIDSQFAQAQSAAGLSAAQAQAFNQRALGETRAAYGKARTGYAQGRANAIQYAQDAGAQQQANAAQSLASRGLGNTTIVENAQQGISAGVSRAVSDIDAQYAQMLASLGIGEAQATSGIRARQAASAQDLGRLQAGLHAQLGGIYASLPQEDPNQWLNSLLQIGGTAIGYGIGSGGGGGGGGSPGVYYQQG